MKDNHKTKAQLISELEDMRDRVAGLEEAASHRKSSEVANEQFAALGKRLNRAFSPEDAARIILEVADELLGWDACTLDLYSQENDTVYPVVNIDTIGGKRSDVPPTLLASRPTSRMRRALDDGSLLILREEPFNPEEGSIPFGDARASASILFVPIWSEARVIGFVSIQSYSPNAYDSGNLTTLETLADYCGGAFERILAEKLQRESEARLHTIIENMPFAFWARDTEGRCIMQNAHTAAQWGHQIGKFTEDTAPSLDILNRWSENNRRAFAGEVVRDEFEISEGEHAGYYYEVVAPIRVDGEVRGILVVNIDITDRKRAEEALRESEAKFRALAQTAASAILIYQDSKLVYLNPFAVAMTGYSEQEQLSMEFWEIIHPDHRQMVRERGLARLRGEAVPTRYELKLITKSGEGRWMDFSASAIEFQGKPSVLGTALDITERKRTEEALHKSQSRLQHVLSISPAIVYSLRIEGGRLVPEWVSESITRLTGYTITEALVDGWWADHLHPDDRDRALAELPRLFADDRLVLEYRFQHRDGGFHWIHDELRLVRDESGEAVEAVGSWADVTERREAERALRASEERYRDLVENARDIIYTHDLEGNYTSVNRAVEQITGYTREEALNLNFAQSVAPEYLETVRRMVAAKLGGQKETVYDLELVAKDGRRVTVEVNTRLVLQDGVPIGITGIARDVTKRKQAEEALRASQSHLQAILDNCPAMIFQKDLDGRYLQVNRQFERTFNLSAEQVLGQTDAELFRPDLAAAFSATDRTALAAGHSLEFEEDAVYADGPHTYIVQKFPLRDSTGKVYAVGGIVTDITARKVAEDELRMQKEILQKIIDHIPVMIRLRDEDGRVRLVNQEWQREMGWALEDIQQYDLDILAEAYPDPEYRKYVLDFIAAATGEWTDFKTKTRDGRVIDTTWASVRLSDGTLIGFGRDITEQKRADEALRAAHARTESVLASVADTHILFDWEWRYIYVNQAAVDAIGRPHEQILSSTLWELYPDIAGTEMERQYRRAMTERIPVAFDFHYATNDTWSSNRFYPSPEGLAVFATNITESKRAEENLRRQKEILQTIFDHAPVMITFIGEDDRIKLVNHEWERTLGWSLEEIRREHLDIFAECYPDPQYRQEVLKIVAESNGVWADFKPRVRDGRVIDTSWTRVRLSDGTSIGIAQDITERKRAEERLRQQTAQLAALHEIELEISAESELSRVLELVIRRAGESQNAAHCSVYIRDPERSELAIAASLDTNNIGLRLREGEGLAGRVVATGEARAIDNYSSWEGRARALESTPLGPALAAPLKWQHAVIGAISLAREPGGEPFTPEEAHFLEQIAAEAAIAIHQATLFEDLQEAHKRLQVLAHSLIDAQEAERKRLSRELHDRIGQALTAVQINLQSMQSGPEGAYRREESLAIVEDALKQAQDLSLELRPSLLDDLGLVAALRWYVDRFARRAKLLRCFSADLLDMRSAPEIETACFRIAQEALTNVIRHAQATTVWVQLKTSDSELQLTIRDDGQGFAVRENMSRNGENMSLGLQGMLERASALGGLVEIMSGLGQGTEVRARFPLKGASPSSRESDGT
jgi:PAS domain S-box-containing protein